MQIDIDDKKSGNLESPLINCWFFPFENPNLTDIASDNENGIYSVFQNGEVLKNSADGRIDWETQTGGEAVSNLLIAGQFIHLFINEKEEKKAEEQHEKQSVSTLRTLDKLTGIALRIVRLPRSDKMYLFEYNGDIIVVQQEGLIYRIQNRSEQIVWRYAPQTRLSSKPLLFKDSIWFGNADRLIIGVSLADGAPLYKIQTVDVPTVISVKSVKSARNETSQIFWGDQKGFINFAVGRIKKGAKDTNIFKERWRFRSGAEVSHLVLTPDGLLAFSFDNFAYLLSERSGGLLWKRRFDGRVSRPPLIVDDAYAIVVTDGETDALIVKLNDGRRVNTASISPGNLFVNGALMLRNKIIFPTLHGLLAFSPTRCQGN